MAPGSEPVNPEPVIEVMSPGSAAARQVLRAYFAEVASRYYGRPAADEEVAPTIRTIAASQRRG